MTPEEMALEVCKVRGLSLVKAVGAGAFKNTFLATEAGKERALKVFRGGLTDRAEREIEAMQRCSHSGVARLLSTGTVKIGAEDIFYCEEEFLAGGTLTARTGSLDPGKVARLAVALSNVLAGLHDLRLVHRDIKPDNIMFRSVGGEDPVVVDFGLVRDLGSTSLTDTWNPKGPGTPYFSAPEQLTNEKALIGWRTDQFGLGVTLAHVWLGKHPYQRSGMNSSQAVQAVAQWQLPDPDFIDQCKQEKLDPIVQMVQPYPVERFRTPADLERAWRGITT